MFVRWKRRKLKKRLGYSPGMSGDPSEACFTLSAVLVRSERMGGKVRQRFVKHLGTIKDWGLTIEGHRLGFWERAEKALDSLDLDSDTRERIEANLAATVKPLTPEEWVRISKEREAWRRGLRGLVKAIT